MAALLCHPHPVQAFFGPREATDCVHKLFWMKLLGNSEPCVVFSRISCQYELRIPTQLLIFTVYQRSKYQLKEKSFCLTASQGWVFQNVIITPRLV